jgi:hypothetical protein
MTSDDDNINDVDNNLNGISPRSGGITTTTNGGGSGYVPNKLRGVTASSSSSPTSRSSALSRLKGRKSRPWRADAASWKQQMRERKAVFHNFAVDEEEAEGLQQQHEENEENDGQQQNDNNEQESKPEDQVDSNNHGRMNMATQQQQPEQEETSSGLRQPIASLSSSQQSPSTMKTTMMRSQPPRPEDCSSIRPSADPWKRDGTTAAQQQPTIPHLESATTSTRTFPHQPRHIDEQKQKDHDENADDDDEDNVSVISSVSLMSGMTLVSTGIIASKNTDDDINGNDQDNIEEQRARREREVEQYIQKMKQKEEMLNIKSDSSVVVAASMTTRAGGGGGYVTPKKNILSSSFAGDDHDDEIMATRSPMPHTHIHNPPSPEEEGDIPMMTTTTSISTTSAVASTTSLCTGPFQPSSAAAISKTSQPSVPSTAEEQQHPQPQTPDIDSPSTRGGEMFMSALFGTLPKFNKNNNVHPAAGAAAITETDDNISTKSLSTSSSTSRLSASENNNAQVQSPSVAIRDGSSSSASSHRRNDTCDGKDRPQHQKSLSDDAAAAGSACCCPLDSMSHTTDGADDNETNDNVASAATSVKSNPLPAVKESDSHDREKKFASLGRPKLSVDTSIVNEQGLETPRDWKEERLDTPHPVLSAVKTSVPTLQSTNIEETTISSELSPPVRPDPLQKARKGFMLSDLHRSLQNRPRIEDIIESESNNIDTIQRNDRNAPSTSLFVDAVFSSSDDHHKDSISQSSALAPQSDSQADTSTSDFDNDGVDDYDGEGLSGENGGTVLQSPKTSGTSNNDVDDLEDLDDYDGVGVTNSPRGVGSPRKTTIGPQNYGDNALPSLLSREPSLSFDPPLTEAVAPSKDIAPSPRTLQKNRIMTDLTDRLQTMNVAHHKCIEATGRAGLEPKAPPKELSPSERKTFESRGNVFNELNTRVASIYIDNHYIVESPSVEDGKERTQNDGLKDVDTPKNNDRDVALDNQSPEQDAVDSEITTETPQTFPSDIHGSEETGESGQGVVVQVVIQGEVKDSKNDKPNTYQLAAIDVGSTAGTLGHKNVVATPRYDVTSESKPESIILEDVANDETMAKPNKRRESVKGKKWKDRLASKKASKGSNKEENVSAEMSVPSAPAASPTTSVPNESHGKPTQSGQSPDEGGNSAGKSNKWKARLAKLRGASIPSIPAVESEKSSEQYEIERKASTDSPKSEDIELEKAVTPDVSCTSVAIEPQKDTKTSERVVVRPGLPSTDLSTTRETIMSSQNENTKRNVDRNELHTSFNKFDQFLSARPDLSTDDESVYTEVTIGQDFLTSTAGITSKGAIGVPPSNDEDEQSYMEYTVDESVQASYMEETVYSEYTMGPKAMQGTPAGNQMISPFMSNLLSSRMFQDVTPSIPVQQDNSLHRHFDHHDKKFPTIHVHSAGDDDDMTQITMDHGLHEMDEDEDEDDEANTNTPRATSNSQQFDAMKNEHEAKSAPNPTGLPPPAPSSDSKTIGRPPPAPVVEKSPSILSVKSSSKSLKSSKSKTSRHSNKSRRSQGDSSATSQLSSESSKQRMTEIIRKEIWSRDALVVRGALDELSREAVKGYKYRFHIVRLGGIMAVMRTMEMNGGDEAVLASCCKILGVLSLEPENQILVCEMEGIPLITRAMQDFPDVVQLQEAGCTSLATICRRQESESANDVMKDTNGAVLTLLIAMTKNPNNSRIRAKAFSAISNLCMESKDRLAELAEAGGIMTLTMALQKSWDDMNEQHEAISNLSILLRGVAELNAGHAKASSSAALKTESTETMNENDDSNSSLETQEDENGDGGDAFSSVGDEQLNQNIVAIDSDLDYAAAELESLPRIGGTPKNDGTSRTSSDDTGSMSTNQRVENENGDACPGDTVNSALGDNSELEDMINRASSGHDTSNDKDPTFVSLNDEPIGSSEGAATDSSFRGSSGSWTPTDFVKHPEVPGSDVDQKKNTKEKYEEESPDDIDQQDTNEEEKKSEVDEEDGDEKCAIQ